MATTPLLHLPYPVLADPADVPADIKRLAEAVEAAQPPFVSALPASPVNGQECNFLADAAAGVVWRLRYKADAPGAYKWLVLGATDLWGYVASEDYLGLIAGNLTWGNLTTVGPDVTVPLAGDYDVAWGASSSAMGTMTTNGRFYMGIASGDTDPPEPFIRLAQGDAALGTFYQETSRRHRRLAVPAGTILRARYRWENDGGLLMDKRWLAVRPVRVG